jgi:hypothetical protein
MLVSSAPPDASCLEIQVSGPAGSATPTLVTQLEPLSPGQSASFTLHGLPLGTDTFSEEAFGVPCSAVTASTPPTWVSDPTTATLQAGVVAQVIVVLHPNGQASITSEFDAGAAPPGDAGSSPIDAGPPPGDGGGSDGSAASAPPSIKTLALSTNDLVFDPARNVLYATLNPTDAGAGNSVVTIDPAAGAVTGTLFVGSNPNVLAISDDSSALYVGIDGANSVCRVDLSTNTAGALVSLGSNSLSARTAGQIAAVPGSSTQYVVSRRQPGFSPSFAGLALFDGATMLTEWNGFVGGESIAFADPSTLYGYNNDDTGFDLERFSVGPGGITPGQDVTVISGFQTRITYQGGWIFATNGQAVSAANLAAVGTYNASGPVLADADGSNVWFLQASSFDGTPELLDFDRTTFLLRRSISLAAATAADSTIGSASALVRWSPTGLAFRTPSAVYLVTAPN